MLYPPYEDVEWDKYGYKLFIIELDVEYKTFYRYILPILPPSIPYFHQSWGPDLRGLPYIISKKKMVYFMLCLLANKSQAGKKNNTH